MLSLSSFGTFLQEFLEKKEKKLAFKFCPLFFQISEDNTINLGSSGQSALTASMSINSEIEFDYSDEFGLIWHKNWLIPNISVYLPVDKNSVANEHIYLQIFVVKAELTQNKQIFLKNVGVKGQCQKQKVLSSKTVFKNLKFKSTSYQHNSLKFHLLFLLYSHKNSFNNKNMPNHYVKLDESGQMILIELHDSKLSSPFYIDSRKIASAHTLSKTFSLFDPLLLEREMTKRRKERAPDIKIDNNYDGLVNYIIAPNLRKKTNHPFFLALRFPNIVKLWINKKIFKNNSFNEKLVQILKLIESFYKNSDCFKLRQKKRVVSGRNLEINETAYLGMTINKPEEVTLQKKVNEYFGLYDDRLITIIFKKKELIKGFEKISDLIELQEIYIKFYKKSKTTKNRGEMLISEITTTIDISGESQVITQRKKVHIEKNDQPIKLEMIKETELLKKKEKEINQNFLDETKMLYLKGWREGWNSNQNGYFVSMIHNYLNKY